MVKQLIFLSLYSLVAPTHKGSQETFSKRKLDGDKYNETHTMLVPVEDNKHMDSKFSRMKGYASILHGSIFGEPFEKSYSWVIFGCF